MTTASSAEPAARALGTALGRRPADWALSEDQQLPTYEAALAASASSPASACSTSAAAPARSCGWSPSAAASRRHRRLRGAARARRAGACRPRTCASADGALPWDDDTFDLVTGFNPSSSRTTVAALREARGSQGRARPSSSRSPGRVSAATSRRCASSPGP